jgi:hypothetical protein
MGWAVFPIFDSGKQWQSDLGGNQNWKNRPTHSNGEHSMLIDMNGDGLLDLSKPLPVLR